MSIELIPFIIGVIIGVGIGEIAFLLFKRWSENRGLRRVYSVWKDVARKNKEEYGYTISEEEDMKFRLNLGLE